MLNSQNVIAYLATADVAACKDFYQSKLGLVLTCEDDFALVFDLNGIDLRIQKVAAVSPPQYTVLGWAVTSVRDTVRQLTKNGVIFDHYAALKQDVLGIWASPSGAQIAWFRDPDGHTLSLTQYQ